MIELVFDRRHGSAATGTDRRPTRPGRALVAEHREQLSAAEAAGNHHHDAWRHSEPTPVGPTFDELARRWESLPEGGSMTLRWPSLEPVDVAAGR